VGHGIQPLHVPDLLNQLTEKSMLLLEEAGGRARFRSLETVRSYSEDKLREAPYEQETRWRHALWYLDVARKAAAAGRAELAELEVERDNFRSALTWAVEHDEGLALELVVALRPFWEAGQHLAEGRRWTEQVTRSCLAEAGPLLTDALEGLAWLLMRQGD
jgi:predicted ATPase